MRTPTLALVAAAALGSSIVAAKPLPAPGSYSSNVYAVSDSEAQSEAPPAHRLHPVIGTKMGRAAAPDHSSSLFSQSKIEPRELIKKALDAFTAGGNAYSGSTGLVSGGSVANGRDIEHTKRTTDDGTLGGNAHSGDLGDVDGGDVMNQGDNYGTPTLMNGSVANRRDIDHTKRTTDDGTLGGNAYSGKSGDVDGGDVVNQGDNFGMPTMLNMNSNNAGAGGGSITGCANGGHGNNRGAGGNGYSGDSGNAQGGSVWNSGGVMNIDSNNAGGAGTSESGCATGGGVSDDPATE